MTKFRKVWTEEIASWLVAHKDLTIDECYKLFQETFQIHDVTRTAFCNQRCRVGGSNNKCSHPATKQKPLYSEHIKKGYVFIKVAQPNVWVTKSRWIYEEYNPGYVYEKGDRFLFLDGDNRNFHPENIAMIKIYEMTIFNNMHGVIPGKPELTRINLLKARLRHQQYEAAEKAGLCQIIVDEKGCKQRYMQTERKKYYEEVMKPKLQTPERRKIAREKQRAYFLRLKLEQPELYEQKLAKHRAYMKQRYLEGKNKK